MRKGRGNEEGGIVTAPSINQPTDTRTETRHCVINAAGSGAAALGSALHHRRPLLGYTATMRSNRPNCVFCERLLQGRSDVLWDQALARTDDYLVVPTKGSLLPGWVLVVANTHILCAGALEAQSVAAFDQGLRTAQALVESKFGPVTMFEHGPVTDGSALGCGVDHLHIHAAPLAFSLRAEFQRLYPTSVWHRADDWQELRSVHAAGVPYVAIREPAGALEWCEAPSNVRQPLRRAVASGLGVDEQFDYNLHPYAENATRTIEVLATV